MIENNLPEGTTSITARDHLSTNTGTIASIDSFTEKDNLTLTYESHAPVETKLLNEVSG